MKDTEYLEDINTREFYDFYRKTRRKPSKKIDQYNYFKKAMSGFLRELKKSMEESEHGVHLKGLGVLFKKPFGEWFRKITLFTHKRKERGINNFYLEDEYLRNKYTVKKVSKLNNSGEKKSNKPDAVMLHRKLIKKNAISHT